ncbi:Hypothetical protein A7982_11005 [Minicystis rosea]|nr:Hypothetical protein A7982_11005 [Minicystis rosea]
MSAETLSNLRALVALVLLALSIPCTLAAYARAVRLFRGEADVASRRLLVASLGVAALVRWVIAPKQIVTMYIGYLLTQQAIELSAASHYGMGSLALYHALFGVLPQDHKTLLWINAVVGVLAIPLLATFAARYLRAPRIGAVFAALVATVPLFIKNDASDANHVPCLFWLFGGLVLWEEFLDTGARSALLRAAPLLALAASARPEMPLLLPVLLALFTVGLAPPRARFRDPVLYAVAAVAALVVLPHALHVLGAASALEDRDSLPGANGGLSRMLRSVVAEDTILTPSLYPAALVLLAIVGLGESLVLKRSELRARAALVLAAVIAVATYGLDLCRANMARVHVPGALLVTMLAAAGVAAIWERWPRHWARALLVLAVAGSAVPTAVKLWAATNEQAEEDFLREALARLPAEPYTLVRMDRADRNQASPGSDFTHHHFPDYLVRPPMGAGRVSSIRDWIDEPDFERPSFFYWGMRCHAEFREAGRPPPHGDAVQPACARLRERFELIPVLEKTVPNRGDVWLEYYGDAQMLRLGLYRIRRRGS